MARRALRRLVTIFAATTEVQLQGQAEQLLLLLDPQGPGGPTNPLREVTKRPRRGNEFGEVILQLRSLACNIPSPLNNEDLATDMAVAVGILENGQRQLQLALQDQGGNQALDAVAGAATAAKALRSARDRALADNRDRLSEAWLMTVVALLEEGDMLLRELEQLSPPVHSSDVVALSQGAEESTLEMGATQKVRHLLRELGGLLPFFERREGDALRSLVVATLAWLQRAEGTTVEVNSQGEAETQPVNTTSSLFGDHVEHPTAAETLLEQTGADYDENYTDQPAVAEGNPAQTEAADDKGQRPADAGETATVSADGGTTTNTEVQPLFWNLRGDMSEGEVPSSAERPTDDSPPASDDLSASAVAEALSPSRDDDVILQLDPYYQSGGRRRLRGPVSARRRAFSDASD